MMGRDWLRLPKRLQSQWAETAFLFWRRRGFPYIEMTPTEVNLELSWLLKTKPETFIQGDLLRVSMLGLRSANFFHPQMWHVPVHDYKTVFERYQDDASLKDCIRKAFYFFPNRNSVNAQCLRSTLRIYRGTTRVSNFRPTVARSICARYSNNSATVLDFSAGYGGRLLGCMTLPRHYVGIDPCSHQVEGLNRTIDCVKGRLPGTASIIQACAEEEMDNLARNSVDLVFSSPPYFNHERYSEEPTQSYIRYPTYQEWKARFLRQVIKASHRVLKHRGFLVLNVADLPGIPLVRDALDFCEEHFKMHSRLRMPLYRFPLQRNLMEETFKYESIFIFRKEA